MLPVVFLSWDDFILQGTAGNAWPYFGRHNSGRGRVLPAFRGWRSGRLPFYTRPLLPFTHNNFPLQKVNNVKIQATWLNTKYPCFPDRETSSEKLNHFQRSVSEGSRIKLEATYLTLELQKQTLGGHCCSHREFPASNKKMFTWSVFSTFSSCEINHTPKAKHKWKNMHMHAQCLKLKSADCTALLPNCQAALVKLVNFSKLHFLHLKKMNHTEVIITQNYLIVSCLSAVFLAN